ncbi:MAG: UDP-N-acetylglucosamine--N-acetylmuramyl-(pentapeptide) pyrophosphoryl-undecaprenol N-acetylglucosamine transferase [Verrucomicrobia bacterium]|nr:UDP-N-acetylglucosamine--N-acetylmuramyl-(pentapeptide) pyrophosphoryl-undecaprenol N-acetylglucosamine transferase [Verrucomicrobiota bacterium]
MAKYLIICGGTGGHLAPGIALAQKLQTRGNQCELVVSCKEVDNRLCAKYQTLKFRKSPGMAFSAHPLKCARFLWQTFAALVFAFKLIRDYKPDAVIAFGGFTSPPFGIVARLMGCTLIVHEANRVPGKAIRCLSRFADRVYLPEGVRLHTVRPRVLRHFGFPVRADVKHVPKEEAKPRINVPLHSKLLVIFGGSQGAQPLNDWVNQTVRMLVADGICVYCITGPGKGAESTLTFESDDGQPVQVHYKPFTDNVGLLLSSADLVISRAGAGSIAELITCLAPSILVPFPHATDNHQELNARHLERQGGCMVVLQKDIGNLYREVLDLIFNDWLLSRMRENLRGLNRADWAYEIALDIERIVRRKEQFADERRALAP